MPSPTRRCHAEAPGAASLIQAVERSAVSGAVGLGRGGGDSTRVGAQGEVTGRETPVLGTSACVGLHQSVTSRALPVYRGFASAVMADKV
jgi:hypothetical protein